MIRRIREAVWSVAYINDLPDSAFAFIEPGGEKDADGKTAPRSKRHFPLKDANGNYDAAHVRNALARAPQSPIGARAMLRIHAAARSLGIGQPAQESADDRPAPTNGSVELFERTVGRPKGVEGRIIKGVAILNSSSRNGRYYPPDVMRKAMPLFEGARSYVDHPTEGDGDRSWRDLLGKFQNIAVEDTEPGHARMTADFRVFAGQDGDRALDMAEKDPDACGFSIRARGHVADDGHQERVESIDRVMAVELVDAPGATSGLFESKRKRASRGDDEMELKEQLQAAESATRELEAQNKELQEAAASATKEIDELKAKVALGEREQSIDKAIQESGLTGDQVSEAFRAALRRCENDEQIKAMVEDRKAALGVGEPESSEKHALTEREKDKAPSVDEVAEMVSHW